MFNVRPYKQTDESAVYRICKESCRDACHTDVVGNSQYPELVPDKLVGALLTLSPQYCSVIEDEAGDVCGYFAAALDANAFHKQYQMAWAPVMQAKYPPSEMENAPSPTKEMGMSFHEELVPPAEEVLSRSPSLVQAAILPSAAMLDSYALQRAAVSVFSALHANGSSGAHVELPALAAHAQSVYTDLGFVTAPSANPAEICTLGRLI